MKKQKRNGNLVGRLRQYPQGCFNDLCALEEAHRNPEIFTLVVGAFDRHPGLIAQAYVAWYQEAERKETKVRRHKSRVVNTNPLILFEPEIDEHKTAATTAFYNAVAKVSHSSLANFLEKFVIKRTETLGGQFDAAEFITNLTELSMAHMWGASRQLTREQRRIFFVTVFSGYKGRVAAQWSTESLLMNGDPDCEAMLELIIADAIGVGIVPQPKLLSVAFSAKVAPQTNGPTLGIGLSRRRFSTGWSDPRMQVRVEPQDWILPDQAHCDRMWRLIDKVHCDSRMPDTCLKYIARFTSEEVIEQLEEETRRTWRALQASINSEEDAPPIKRWLIPDDDMFQLEMSLCGVEGPDFGLQSVTLTPACGATGAFVANLRFKVLCFSWPECYRLSLEGEGIFEPDQKATLQHASRIGDDRSQIDIEFSLEMRAFRAILNHEIVCTVYNFATRPNFKRDHPQRERPDGEDENGGKRVGRAVPPQFRRLPEGYEATSRAIKRSKELFQGQIPPPKQTFVATPPQVERKPGDPKPWPYVIQVEIK